MKHDRPNENYNREKKYPLNYTFSACFLSYTNFNRYIERRLVYPSYNINARSISVTAIVHGVCFICAFHVLSSTFNAIAMWLRLQLLLMAEKLLLWILGVEYACNATFLQNYWNLILEISTSSCFFHVMCPSC